MDDIDPLMDWRTKAPRAARPNEKWCPGCEAFHSPNAFGLCESRADKLQVYCKAHLRKLRGAARLRIHEELVHRMEEDYDGICHDCNIGTLALLKFRIADSVADAEENGGPHILLCRNCELLRERANRGLGDTIALQSVKLGDGG